MHNRAITLARGTLALEQVLAIEGLVSYQGRMVTVRNRSRGNCSQIIGTEFWVILEVSN